MKRSSKVAIGVGVLLGAATLVAIVASVAGSYRELCEVCIEFRGRTACREAYGRTRAEAVETATDNACAFLASGMTDSVSCGRTPPTTTTCSP